ncbi:AraC family transcriptional regulator [Rasiella rasia]|uniref:AraC family transcriptional regulator n=1 Tax=Rasiella rasia TaxID=2744027 RepID=A0A6G6GIU9_9FLAO|nr:helix-turn-helix domain-containing protein [Rasiella rasia]QIE58343.1 AraC family transcriptional regulator [Rasiella rasia]
MNTIKFQLLLTSIIMCISILDVKSQNLEQSTLNTLDDESLLALYDEHYGDSLVLEKIARTYLDRARKQKDTIKMARGYDRLARTFHPEKNIAFADSLIALTKDMQHITYPGIGFIIKGSEFAKIDLFQSTKYYYMAYDYAVANNNISHQLYVLNILITRKAFWGDAEEALKMQKEREVLIDKTNFRKLLLQTFRNDNKSELEDYIHRVKFNSEMGFAVSFINMRKLDSAKVYLEKGKKHYSSIKNLVNLSNELILLEIENEISFYSEDYLNTIKISDKILDKSIQVNEHGSIYDAYLFKGIALIRTGDEKLGVKNLLAADSIYANYKLDVLPYRRNVFVELLEYYRKNNNHKQQIEFYKKITYIDSILKRNYSFYDKSLDDKIVKPKLFAEKDALIDVLYKENQSPDPELYVALGAFSISLCFALYFFRKRLVYKRRLEALMNSTEKVPTRLKKGDGYYKKEIGKEIAEDILIKLEGFEEKNQFLKTDVSLISLAKKFKTNPNYLSRVINLKLEKNFSQYLHDLRIAYALEHVLSNSYYHKYTIKAIAEECGYNSAGSFSRAFYRKTGIYPSYYIENSRKKK